MNNTIILSASKLIDIISAKIAQYNTLLRTINGLKNSGYKTVIKSKIFSSKNRLMGILSRLRTKSSHLAIAVPAGMGVSQLIKTLGR